MAKRENFKQQEQIKPSYTIADDSETVEMTPTIVTNVAWGGNAEHAAAPTPAPAPVQESSTAPMPGQGETEVVMGFQLDDNTTIEPTVGWLVCIAGPCKGKDFRLHAGWNYIGRDPEMDISIPDQKISRARTARVSYDPRSRTFAVAMCEGAKTIAYVHNKPLYSVIELTAYDVISMGETDLLFIPMCGEKFAWEG